MNAEMKCNDFSESMGTLARGTVTNLAGSAFNFVSRFIINLVIARLLGPSLLGIYYITLTISTGLGLIAVGGLDTTVVRYLARHRADRNWGAHRGTIRFAVLSASAIGLLGWVILVVAAPWLANSVFHKPQLTTALRIGASYGPLYALETLLLAATQSFKVMKYKAYIASILDPALRIVLVVGVYLLGGGLYSILAAYVFGMLVCTVLSFVALRRCLPPGLSKFVSTVDRGELLRYSFPLFAVTVVSFLVIYGDSMILAHFRSSQEVGLYAVCVRLMLISGFALPIVSQIFAPIISELHHRGQIAHLEVQLKVVTLWAVEVYVPILLLFVVVPRQILAIFGKVFEAAALCLVILAISQFFNLLTGPVGLVLNMSGWTRLELWNVTSTFVFQILLAFLLIPHMGILGAAVADGSAVVVINLVRVLQLRRRLGIHPFSILLGKPLLAALVAFGAIIPFLPNLTPGWSIRAVSLILGVLFSYFGMLVVLGLDHHSRIAWQRLRQMIAGYFPSTPLAAATGKDIG